MNYSTVRGEGNMEKEQSTRVVILTAAYRIVGDINLVPGGRLTDYMDTSHGFLAVTNAKVTSLEGCKEILEAEFLNIRVNAIEIVLPVNEVKT